MKRLLIGALLVAAGCAVQNAPVQSASSVPAATPLPAPPKVDPIKARYPDLAALYGGEIGIYRTCATNQGVCHNDHEYPNLSTLGAVVQTIRADCNITHEDPKSVHDLCERKGDLLTFGKESIEIAGLLPSKKRPAADPFNEGDSDPRIRLALRRPMPAPSKRLPKRGRIVRERNGERIDLGAVDLLGVFAKGAIDVRQVYEGEGGARVALPGTDPYGEPWGGVSDPLALQLGDPNANGVYGAELGGALVVPGKPEKSYLMTRLIDPSAGPLMPRANCCTWSKASLRALYCWIAGLAPDGKNALAPIDYDKCPPGPAEDVMYPELGPACETSGMCPVAPRVASSSSLDGSWPSVWKKVLSSRCAGSACHGDAARGVLDLKTEDAAYKSVREHVVVRMPEKSEVYVRISPELCRAPSCIAMPLKAAPLDADARALVRRWIERGAPRD